MNPRTGIAAALALGACLGYPRLVAADCTVAATGVVFGAYDVFAATPLASIGTVTYRCDAGTIAVAIDLSKGSSASYANRTLTNGAAVLNYNLYLNAAGTG